MQQVSGNATTDTDVSVLVTDTVLLAANTSRRFLMIVNTGASHIRVRFGQASTTTTGIQIRGSGGALVLDRIVPTGAVNAIGETATTAVSVTEY